MYCGDVYIDNRASNWLAFDMHGELLGTHTTPQTVVMTGQPAMWAMPGAIGTVPNGHVPVHGCAGGGRGGA